MRKKGRDMLLLINDVETACARNYNLDMDSEQIPLAQIQSGDWANSKQGIKFWSLSAEHLLTSFEDNFDQIFLYYDTGQTVTVKLRDA